MVTPLLRILRVWAADKRSRTGNTMTWSVWEKKLKTESQAKPITSVLFPVFEMPYVSNGKVIRKQFNKPMTFFFFFLQVITRKWPVSFKLTFCHLCCQCSPSLWTGLPLCKTSEVAGYWAVSLCNNFWLLKKNTHTHKKNPTYCPYFARGSPSFPLLWLHPSPLPHFP